MQGNQALMTRIPGDLDIQFSLAPTVEISFSNRGFNRRLTSLECGGPFRTQAAHGKASHEIYK